MLMVNRLLGIARGGRSVSEMLGVADAQSHTDGLIDTTGGPLGDPRMHGPVVTFDLSCSCDLAALTDGRTTAYPKMTTTAWLKLLDELGQMRADAVIFAGDPLRSPDIYELLTHAAKLDLPPRVVTRGGLFDAKTAAELVAIGVPYIGVELDWDPDLSGQRPHAGATLSRALRTLRRSLAASLPVGAHLRLTRENIAHLDTLVGFAHGVGARRLRVQHVWDVPCACVPTHAIPDVAAARAALTRLFRLAASTLDEPDAIEVTVGDNDSDAALLLLWVQRRYGVDAARRIIGILSHYANHVRAGRHLLVNSGGWCRASGSPSGLPLGNVQESGLRAVVARPLAAYRDERSDIVASTCAQCSWGVICRGAAALHGLPSDAPTDRVDPTCLLDILEHQDNLARFPKGVWKD